MPSFYPAYAPVPAAITLTVTGDAAVGQFVLATPEVAGYVQVWVGEPASPPRPRRESSAAFALDRIFVPQPLPGLTHMSIMFNYLEREVPAGEEAGISIYYLDETNPANGWQKLETVRNPDYSLVPATKQCRKPPSFRHCFISHSSGLVGYSGSTGPFGRNLSGFGNPKGLL